MSNTYQQQEIPPAIWDLAVEVWVAGTFSDHGAIGPVDTNAEAFGLCLDYAQDLNHQDLEDDGEFAVAEVAL